LDLERDKEEVDPARDELSRRRKKSNERANAEGRRERKKGGELAIVLSKGASRVISDELLQPGLTNG
jgi:hypothetical protein